MIALYSKRILLPEGLDEATVLLSSGVIKDVMHGRNESTGYRFIDHGENVIMPGLIDSHVHINEPGRTHWEGFETATKAAAAGGITTLIEMPLNSNPVTTNAAAFHLKLAAAKNKSLVNCGFYGGVIPGNDLEIEELIRAGVFGIKAFLTYSGIEDFQHVSEEDLIKIMPTLRKYDLPLLVHCELSSVHDGIEDLTNNPTNYQTYLNSRPRSWENNAIALVISLCEKFDIRVHIVHVSSSDALTQIKAAKEKGLRLTAETCPHYLYFNSEDITDGNTLLKCAPPIREKENNEKLWQALENDVLDFIVTDHSPAPPELKAIESGNFEKAWGGIAGLQFSLSVVWTKARNRGWTVVDLNRKMSLGVANFLGLDKKGQIKPGFDADLVIWSPKESFVVKESEVNHRHKLTPYLGERLFGKVTQTICAGSTCCIHGKFGNERKEPIIVRF